MPRTGDPRADLGDSVLAAVEQAPATVTQEAVPQGPLRACSRSASGARPRDAPPPAASCAVSCNAGFRGPGLVVDWPQRSPRRAARLAATESDDLGRIFIFCNFGNFEFFFSNRKFKNCKHDRVHETRPVRELQCSLPPVLPAGS